MKKIVLLLIVAFLFVGCDDLNKRHKKAKEDFNEFYSYQFGDRSQKQINLYLKELIDKYAYQDSPLYIPVIKNNCGKKTIGAKTKDSFGFSFTGKATKELSQKDAIEMILAHLGLEIIYEKSFEKEEVKFMPAEEYEKLLADFEADKSIR